jgi:signal transduction histidine kinase
LATANERLSEEIRERTQAQETLREKQRQLEREHQILARLLSEHDRERQMLSYEIHDGLAQTLAGAIMQFQVFCGQFAELSESAAKARENLQALLDQSLAEARRLISGVRPPVLDDSGVLVAIQDLIDAHNNRDNAVCEFECDVSFQRLDPVLEITLYRIAQESLANAIHHSGSDRIHVRVDQRKNFIRIKVQDWGVGFDPREVDQRHFGLQGIRERATRLGGTAQIISAPEKGTQVVAELPLKTN